MSINFDKIHPWSQIKNEIIDGQHMVKIPKFYVKVVPSDGINKKTWWVSGSPRQGYHIHPAFMRDGKEIDCFYLGIDYACNDDGKAGSILNGPYWANITFAQAQNACQARNVNGINGFHMQTVYERHAFCLLALLENGSPDIQSFYKDVRLHSYFWEWVDGIEIAGNTVYIFDNKGFGNYINTNYTLLETGDNYEGIQSMAENKGNDFDLTDLFISSSVTVNNDASTYGDGMYNKFKSGDVKKVLVGGTASIGNFSGPFSWSFTYNLSFTNDDTTFRLAYS